MNIAQKVIRNNSVAIILTLIAFISIDLSLVFSRNFAVGIDGYYYLLQLNSIKDSSALYFSSTTPLVIFIFSIFNVVVNNPIYAIKLGTILLQLLLYFGLFILSSSLTNKRLGLLAVGLCFLSGLHRYLLVEYLSQLGGLAFLVWGLVGTVKFYQTKNRWWLLFGSLFFLAAIGSHRSILPVISVALWCFLLWFSFLQANKSRSYLPVLAVFALLLFSIFLPALIVISQNIFTLPFETQNNITAFPQLPFRLSTLPEVLILLIFAPLCLLLLIREKTELSPADRYCLGAIALFAIIITLNPFLSSSLGFSSLGGRLRVLAFIQVALLVPGGIYLINKSDFKPLNRKIIIIILGILVSGLMMWSYFLPLPRGVQNDFLRNRASLIQALENNKQNFPAGSLILANHGQQFLVTAITGIESQQKYPADSAEKQIYWLLEKVPPTLIDNSMFVLLKDNNSQVTVLVKDDENWRKRLANPVFNDPIRRNNRHLDVYLAQIQAK